MDGINLKQVPVENKKPRSSFDLSFKRAFDYKFGDLIPVLMLPVVPDDEISVSYEFLHRMAPFLSQVFQDYKVCFDFYYVPNSLVYNNFELMMSAGYNGNTQYIHPYVLPDYFAQLSNLNFQHSIFDYFDINPFMFLAPSSALQSEHFNAIPFAAYIQCYLDHHLPADTALNKLLENIMSNEYIVTDGDCSQTIAEFFGQINSNNPNWSVPSSGKLDPASWLAPFKRLYPLDYFTSARANSQLGPVMTIPLQLVNTDSGGTQTFTLVNNASMSNSGYVALTTTQGSKEIIVTDNNTGNKITVNGSVFKNVASINDFYSAAKIQELLALYNYSGFSPGDRLAAEYGVKNPDASLHKAEWLHSSIHDVSIGEVFSNNVNAAPSSNPLMDVPGSGTAISATSQSDRGFKAYFRQHGYIVGLMSCYPEAAYSQGIPRHFSIADRFDYPHFLLSEIGMASIRQKELIAVAANVNNWNDTFAYMSQYGDSKVGINRVNGNMRLNLRYMSAGREFVNPNTPNYIPQYNDEFLQVRPAENDLNRTFNVVSTYSHDCPLLSKVSFNIRAKRQLPYYGLPRI